MTYDFRLYSKEQNKIIYPENGWYNRSYVGNNGHLQTTDIVTFINGKEKEILSVVVMQFTGKEDTNEVKIYEKDIVVGLRDSHWHSGQDKVEGFVYFNKETLSYCIDGLGAGTLFDIDNLKVTGNTYEY